MQTELSTRIRTLKAQCGSNLVILGHHYQCDAVMQHCDVRGDSLELARKIADIQAEHIVFCGVYFMAESAAILAKAGQKVYIPDASADCMMALMANPAHVERVLTALSVTKKVIPLAYVNTSLAVKAEVGKYGGAVCTSANAKTMLTWALNESDHVLFLPDKHLAVNTARSMSISDEDCHLLHLTGSGFSGSYEELAGKRLFIWPGCCPIHAQIRVSQIEHARRNAKVYVHPECPPEVVQASDGSGSTSFLIKKAAEAANKKSGSRERIVIATESNLVRRLSKEYSETCDIAEAAELFCPDMNAVTEEKLCTVLEQIVRGTATPIHIPAEEQEPARRAITTMLSVCEKASS